MSLNCEDNANVSDRIKKLFESWRPLEENGNKVLIWDYRKEENIAVIYRFVIGKNDIKEVFTIYVGSGNNLSGKQGKTSLVEQYKRGARKNNIRRRIEDEIEEFRSKGYDAWTEIIELGCLKNTREKIENLAIVKYWLEYIKKKKLETKKKIPKFVNEKIEKIGEIINLVINLGLVG